MTRALHAESALLPAGWARDVRVTVDAAGRIAAVEPDVPPAAGDLRLGRRILLPAPGNLHSHAFQRAMAGMTEGRGPEGRDSFWTWRRLMYRFLETLSPEDVEAIAALVFVESLESGYAAIGEFHYLHNQPDGAPYDDPAELSRRIAAAAAATGIGLTHLPVLYMQGGCDGRPLEGGQRRFGADPDGFARIAEGAADALRALPADAGAGIAPHSLRAVPPEALRALLAATPSGAVHIHAAEQVKEVEEVEAALGARPVRWLLDEAGAGPRWCLIHCTQMTPDETRDLARASAVAGLCPETEANLGDGVFDGVAFLDAGGRFGTGSDSNIRIGVASELRQLEYTQRLRDRGRAMLCEPGGSTGRRLYEAAAKGSAQALGRASGAIAPGLWADLAALDGDSLALAGLGGDMALDAWIFAGGGGVTDLWSAGRHVVREGRHVARDTVEAAYRRTLARLRASA